MLIFTVLKTFSMEYGMEYYIPPLPYIYFYIHKFRKIYITPSFFLYPR